MGYRSQTGSRRGSGEKFQKSPRDKSKAKAKARKAESGVKYAPEEAPVQSAVEIGEKTNASFVNLGSQVFAVSPFSQYFDDWLVNLRQVISEFESNPAITADEEFVKERTRILLEVEGELAKNRIRESELEASAKALAESNHILVEMDSAYATQTRELAAKRNSEIERLTKAAHEIEEELAKVEQMKTSFFGFTKKAKARKQEETAQRHTAAEKQLEMALQNFTVEQDKLHDEYASKKQALIEKVQRLEKEISNIETDRSAQTRQEATAALIDAVKALLQRKKVQAQ